MSIRRQAFRGNQFLCYW